MASCHSRGESLVGGSAQPPTDAMAMSLSKLMQSPDNNNASSVAEWRSRSEQMEPSPPSTSPAYWDTDDDDDASNSSSMTGPKPTDLYGKFTWKIENFSEISKRELRSNVFEVGGYKWYILVYPQGCDVCNHLSLFLCVADYDKLLPGWSHFAQFTIAVVNKDPKKSKYSDTLHRFCKKEHDWGWKKFMELSKVLDGFTVADTLVIKAQVQVIRENPNRPFRCLDCQYRRELVRVYLTNVEGICRRFVEEKREKLGKLMEDAPRWASFRAFWSAVEDSTRRRLAREKTEVILKAVVKRFFNEKEVTSTLVMDALYSGCKALDYRSRSKKGNSNGVDMEEVINPLVCVDKDAFVLTGDVLSLLERAVSETLPPYKDDKGPQNRTKDGSSGDDFGKDSVEQDERRLTELGRRTVEMFVLTHLYTNRVEVAYREAVALRRQEELIREEEAAGQAETELRAKREAAEKEKRSKKKQAKQRRKDRKEKDKEAEEKRVRVEQESRQRPSDLSRAKERLLKERNILLHSPADVEEDDLSGLDTVDNVIVGTLGPATEDGDVDRTSWDREGSYGQSGMEAAGFSGALLEEGSTRNGRIGRKHHASVLDDSSSTCSTDSLPSVRPCMNGSYNSGPSVPEHDHAVSSRARSRGDSEAYENDGRFIEAEGMRVSAQDRSGPGEASSSSSFAGLDAETVIMSLKERVRWLEQRLSEKDEEVVMLQEQVSLFQHQMGLDRPSQCRSLSEDATCVSRVGPMGAASTIQANEIRSGTSKNPVQTEDAETYGLSKVSDHHSGSSKAAPSMNGHTSASIESTAPSGGMLPSQAGNSGDSYSLYTGKVDGAKSPSLARSRGNEASRGPRVGIPPFSTGSSSFSRTPSGIEDTSPATYAATTASVSLTGFSQRAVVSNPTLQGQPPLSRSLSAAARLGQAPETSPGVHSNGNTHHSPPVTPSYRNAAAGKMRGSAGIIPYSVTGAGSFGGAGPGPALGTATTSACTNINTNTPTLQGLPHQSTAQAVSSTTTPLTTSPPSATPQKISKHAEGSMQSTLGGKVETVASSSATIVPVSPLTGQSTSETSSTHSLPQQEISSGYGSVGARRTPVGFTFGTVTPEMLQQKQQEQQQEQLQLQQQQKEEQALLQQQRHSSPEDIMDQNNKQDAQVLNENATQQHPQASTHHHSVHQNLPTENGGLNGVIHTSTMASLMESVNTGGIMGEEFPHLDIINDLLEDDQSFSMALSAMLQHPGATPFNGHHLRMFGYPEMHKLNQYGQLRSDGGGAVNGVAVDGSDRGRMSDDDRSHMHGVEGNGLNLRESRRMTSSFSHQPLGRLHSQHSGHLDGVASHYWPITSAGIPAGNNNVRNGLDTHMGYPLVPDFSMGHSGYSGYSPAQQL